jgi:putative peptidoglycan lipid II flippase
LITEPEYIPIQSSNPGVDSTKVGNRPKKIYLSVFVVSLFTFAGLIVSFFTQMVTAALFGAKAGMDAYLAASAVPQYVISVLIGSLGFVFIPVFVDYLSTGHEDEAWQLASSLINLTFLILGTMVALGILFPGAILGLTAPGLPDATHRLAAQIAMITWPAVLATSMITLLTGIYQSQSRFGWPAAVPVIGAIINLGLIIILANRLGIIGLAIATTLGLVLQVVLLLPLALKKGRYRLMLNWRHPALWQVLRLLLPLVLANFVSRSTPLVERFLASGMPEGSISHLGYAFKIFSILIMLISNGITVVIFPRMAVDMAGVGLSSLRRTMSAGLRLMWLAIAPVMTIGIALALSIVSVVFRHGQFKAADAVAVTGLLQIYLLALAPACLGNVTGRGFYVLKDTRTMAVLSSIESVAYVVYTAILARYLGAIGVVLGYVLLFNGSLLWQVLILRHKTGKAGGRTVLSSFTRTGLAALLGGATAWGVMRFTSNIWIQSVLGGVAGLLVYGAGLWIFQSPEIHQIWSTFRLWGKPEPIAVN